MSCALVCALLAGMALAADDDAPTTKLKWGDPAPPLAIQEFVQGEPVEQFESGKVYVVEFWATWCGPCLESIPHLSKLQKEHPDVVFLGVSIDEERILVLPFVKKMRGKMTYRVAIEAHLEDDHAGAMSLGWLAAADASVIPTAFIVDGERRVAWIGHPDELEEPLEEIVAGEWDIASAWSERE